MTFPPEHHPPAAAPPESAASGDDETAAVLQAIQALAQRLGKTVILAEPAATPVETPCAAGKPPPAAAAGKKANRLPRRFRLTDRDYAILTALNAYRYLRTGQIQRLLFPDCRSVQMARRRLRHLADPHYGYIRRIEPYVQVGHGSAETAWHLGRAGEEILRARGETLRCYARKNSPQVKHQFLAHALEISEFRVKLTLALRGHPLVALQRVTADFEMQAQANAALGKQAYLLFTEMQLPAAPGQPARKYEVHPDILIVLKGKGRYGHHRQLLFVEIDRGTESLSHLRNKVIGYQLFHAQESYRKFGEFAGFRVLLQTTAERRAENIRTALTGTVGEELVWITDVGRVTPGSLLEGEIWLDAGGRRQAILSPAGAPSG